MFYHRSESDPEDEVTEVTGEHSLVTEVWIEPQHGFVANVTPERMPYDGCTFSSWPEKVTWILKMLQLFSYTLHYLCCHHPYAEEPNDIYLQIEFFSDTK